MMRIDKSVRRHEVDADHGILESTFHAGDTCEYLTAQNAIDAAVAAGADDKTIKSVKLTSPAYGQYTGSDGVLVSEIGSDELIQPTEDFLPRCAGAKIASHIVDIPANSAIAIRVDDAYDSIITGTSYGGLSMADYCRANGIPLTLAIVTNYLGQSGRLTVANVNTLHKDYGFEIASHSLTHATASSATMAEDEIVGSYYYLREQLTSRAPIRTFVMPGGWTSPYDMSTYAEMQTSWARRIRQLYECSYASGSVGLNGIQGVIPCRHFTSAYSATAITSSDIADGILRMMQGYGSRLTIYLHNPGTEISHALVKNILDAIIANRDKVCPVTCHTLLTGKLLGYLVNDNRGNYIRNHDFSLYSSVFDKTLTHESNIHPYRPWYHFNTNVDNYAQILDTGGVDDSACIEIIRGTSATDVSIGQSTVLPGGEYYLEFTAKCMNAGSTSNLSVRVDHKVNDGSSASLVDSAIRTFTITDSYKTFRSLFGAPTSSHASSIYFSALTVGRTIRIDNVKVYAK